MSRRGWVYLILLIALLLAQAYHRDARAAAQPSDSDWAKILASNGFGDQAKLLIGLEIVFAESGGNCNATNPSGARGCWQFEPNTLADDTCARDPVCSTKSAYATSKQATDWSKWTTFPAAAKAQEGRARAAISAAAPGCDWVMDLGCLARMVWTGPSVGIPNVGLPSLSNALPNNLLDIWTKLPIDQIGDLAVGVAAYMLGQIDVYLLRAGEALWNAMVSGEDNLGGQTHWGSVLVLDTTPVFKFWAFMVALCSGGLAVFLFMTGNVLEMLKIDSPQHGFKRNVIYLVAGIVGMTTSFWLMQAVLGLSNAFTNTINSYVGLELRSLPIYQNLAAQQHFSVEAIAKDHFAALVEAVGIFIIGIEMLILLFVYLVRAIKIWALAVLLPLAIVAGFIPAARGIVVWWLREFLATVLIKPVNAVLFGLYLLVGVTAEGIVNVAVLIAMLWVMWKVPGWLHEAFSEKRISSVQSTTHAVVASQAFGRAAGFVGAKLTRAA